MPPAEFRYGRNLNGGFVSHTKNPRGPYPPRTLPRWALMETTSPTEGYSETVQRASCSGRTRSLQKRCEYSRTMSCTCAGVNEVQLHADTHFCGRLAWQRPAALRQPCLIDVHNPITYTKTMAVTTSPQSSLNWLRRHTMCCGPYLLWSFTATMFRGRLLGHADNVWGRHGWERQQ